MKKNLLDRGFDADFASLALNLDLDGSIQYAFQGSRYDGVERPGKFSSPVSWGYLNRYRLLSGSQNMDATDREAIIINSI